MSASKKTSAVATDWREKPLGERYRSFLSLQADGAQGEPKRDRTRARIKLAAFDALNSHGDLSQLTVTAVTRAARVAAGTFYLHFSTIRELLLELATEFVEIDIKPVLPRAADSTSLFERMREMFVEAVRSYRILRRFYGALAELRRSDDAVNRAWLAISMRWGRDLAETARRHATEKYSAACMEVLGQSASGATDDLLQRIYIDEVFGASFAENPDNDDYVAELLALIRHRILFGCDPDPELVSEWCRVNGRIVPFERAGKPQGETDT